jgi:hypothetical protein
LILGTAAWSIRLDPYQPLDDASFYEILGKDLSQGGGYRNLYMPGEPRHRHYPPGYPLIIAGVLRGLGVPPLDQAAVPLKTANLVLLLGSVALSFALFRRAEGLLVSFVSLALLAFHPVIVAMAGSVMSEVPYLFFSLLGVLAFERLVLAQSGAPPRARMLGVLLAAAALAWPAYIRMNGVALGAAAVATLLLRRRRREACLVGGAWIALLLPLALMNGGASGGSYGGEWFLKDWDRGDISPLTPAAFVERVAENVASYAMSLPDVLFQVGSVGRSVLPALMLLAGGCMVIGCVRGFRRQEPFRELYVVLFLGILLLWPARGLRYLLPLFPFLQLYAVRGVVTVAQALGRVARLRRPEWVGAASLTVVLLAGLASGWHVHRAEAREVAKPMGRRAAADWGWIQGTWEGIHWIDTTARYGALTMLRKPYLLYVQTGRKGIAYPWGSVEEVVRQAQNYQVDYILEDASARTQTYLKPAVKVLAAQGRIELAHETSGPHPTRVWRLRGGAAAGAPGRLAVSRIE